MQTKLSINDGLKEAITTANVDSLIRMRLKSVTPDKLRRYRELWLRSTPEVRLFMGVAPIRRLPDCSIICRVLAQDIITVHARRGGIPLGYRGIRFAVPADVFRDAGSDGQMALFDVVFSLDGMTFSERVDIEVLKNLDIISTLRDKKDKRLSGWLAVRQLQLYANLRVGDAVNSSVSFNGVRPEAFRKDVAEYMATLDADTRVTASRILLEQSFCAQPVLRGFWKKGGL